MVLRLTRFSERFVQYDVISRRLLQTNVENNVKWAFRCYPTVASSRLILGCSTQGWQLRLSTNLTLGNTNKNVISPKRCYASEASNDDNKDDLQAILKDRSLGITAKFKLLFKQYGLVMTGVHVVTSACWVALIYLSLQQGLDIIPVMENIGVFDFLEKIGLSYAEKLKSSSASVWLMTYLIYELGKPIRYPVTLAGTVYTVRYLRKIGYFKPPPKSATMGQLVETQSQILKQRIQDTGSKYSNQIKTYRRRRSNGHSKSKRKDFHLDEKNGRQNRENK